MGFAPSGAFCLWHLLVDTYAWHRTTSGAAWRPAKTGSGLDLLGMLKGPPPFIGFKLHHTEAAPPLAPTKQRHQAGDAGYAV
ncbi:hypothetical protein ACA910_014659 [Epithemia clementina (nom. ined.)]